PELENEFTVGAELLNRVPFRARDVQVAADLVDRHMEWTERLRGFRASRTGRRRETFRGRRACFGSTGLRCQAGAIGYADPPRQAEVACRVEFVDPEVPVVGDVHIPGRLVDGETARNDHLAGPFPGARERGRGRRQGAARHGKRADERPPTTEEKQLPHEPDTPSA